MWRSLLIQPTIAAALAWAILGEALGPRQAAGGAIVLAGVVLARSGSRRGLTLSEVVPKQHPATEQSQV